MPDSLLHERSAFKALVATVAESERSISFVEKDPPKNQNSNFGSYFSSFTAAVCCNSRCNCNS